MIQILYRLKVEKYYEIEAESIREIKKEIYERGYADNKKFDYVGEYAYAKEVYPAGKHKYEQLDI